MASTRTINRALRGPIFDYIMIGPAVVLFSVFIVWPAIQTLYTSLFAEPTKGGAFIGLGNYREMMGDPVFWIALRNNLIFILANLVLQVGLGTVLAAILDRGIRRGSTLMRTIIFAPLVIAPVAIGVMWKMILEPNFGLLRQLADGIGLPFPTQGILGDPYLAFPAIIGVGVWNYVGFMMTIMLAAMQGISKDVYEAARIDGASAVQTFISITLPGVRYALVLCGLIVIVGSFKTFELVYVLTAGGPGNATQVLGTYIVESAFLVFQPNYAAGMSVIVLLVAILFGSLQVYNRESKVKT
ncbi:carbohydrate ABC transporter permease [Oceaniglobus trochenteri]|uniref:carbohydrate ABC transporter permease n=1 Tax=Oceaniglobus trochenteri TaxID=2763260 RepID=UPI001CFFBABA|nr:sugar ABC transporter permease [Oceaniglobus trochenteri]